MAKKVITQDEITQIAGYVRQGVDIETAAHASAVSVHLVLEYLEAGYYEKMRRDEGEKKPRKTKEAALQLYAAVTQARAQSVINNITKINEADDWKAAKWLLETTTPSLYSQKAANMLVRDTKGEIE